MKEFLKNFNFNKREQRGVFVLFLLLIGFFYASQAIRYFDSNELKPAVVQKLVTMNQELATTSESLNDHDEHIPEINSIKLNSIDLNSVTANELIAAGWPKFLANRVENYLNKGGKIYKPEDLQKLYGMNDSLQVVLGPTIKKYNEIPAKVENLAKTEINSNKYIKKESDFKAFEINSADSTDWITVRGIGPYFASKILTFKNKLGGFYSFDQLYEVYRIDSNLVDSLKPILSVNSSSVNKINLNNCTIDELKLHPYISFNVARAIVNYRIQHGDYKSLTQIKNTGLVTEELYRKIAPYLKLSEIE